MEKKKKSTQTQPPTLEEFENVVRNIMFTKPPTLKEIREMNKAKKKTK